ncbi:MAG TPA: helix-turn-helix domain-containing protein [Pseudonocardia sp.]|jgi:AcrR family transcriptional regulator
MPSSTTQQPNPADRLLDAASALFDREGIRAVGIERLIADAGVARASLYQHFGSKDALVVGYLERADRQDRAGYALAVRGLELDPVARIDAIFTLAQKSARRRRYRGCLYVNALTEFPDRGHPVRQVVLAHREWLKTELTQALAQAGRPDPAALAGHIQLIYDGALVGSKASQSTEPIEQAARLVAGLVGSASQCSGRPDHPA